jgi:hypothetical protein
MDTQPSITIRIPRFLTNLRANRGRLGRALARQMIPNIGSIVLALALLWVTNAQAAPWNASTAAPAWPSTTTINYQGRLADSGGVPLNGNYGMSFALYDGDTEGALLWGPENHPAVPVSDGLFSVQLGEQTSGGIPTSVLSGDIWLEITVAGETLSPRERLGAVPYAMQASTALTVPDGAIDTAQIADGAVTQAKAPTLLGAQASNALVRWGNVVLDTDSKGEGSILFSPAFPSGAYVVVANNGDRGAADFTVQIDGMGRTGFYFKLYHVNGSPLANAHVRIFYIATGH